MWEHHLDPKRKQTNCNTATELSLEHREPKRSSRGSWEQSRDHLYWVSYAPEAVRRVTKVRGSRETESTVGSLPRLILNYWIVCVGRFDRYYLVIFTVDSVRWAKQRLSLGLDYDIDSKQLHDSWFRQVPKAGNLEFQSQAQVLPPSTLPSSPCGAQHFNSWTWPSHLPTHFPSVLVTQRGPKRRGYFSKPCWQYFFFHECNY